MINLIAAAVIAGLAVREILAGGIDNLLWAGFLLFMAGWNAYFGLRWVLRRRKPAPSSDYLRPFENDL